MRHVSAIACVLASGILGCNSGHWVDTPMLTAYICDPKAAVADAVKTNNGPTAQSMAKYIALPTEAEIKKNMEDVLNTYARQTCGQSGGAFTGDTRCENGSGQVKCK